LSMADGDYVQAAIEYSFEKLKQLELEPLTADDFEIIERNCEFIEEQLLNQVGVFYDRQRFVIFNIEAANVSVRLISKVNGVQAKCFYLSVDSELHIAPKLRPQTRPESEDKEGTLEEAPIKPMSTNA